MTAALTLFATRPFDKITVAEIAEAADMVPGSVYYHFSTKEQILVEGVEAFGTRLGHRARELASDQERSAPAVVVELYDWLRHHAEEATVTFVHATGVNLGVEQVRHRLRVEVLDALRTSCRRTLPGRSQAELGVVALALLSLLEAATAIRLEPDVGAEPLRQAVAEVAARIAA